MKLAKRTLALVLAIALAVAVMVVPASAATIEWRDRFEKFATTSASSYQTGYTKAIQSILLGYNDNTYSYIYNAGGVDGMFGGNTELAVKEFQNNEGIFQSNSKNYGKVESTTWRKMAELMTANRNYSPIIFSMNARKAITAKLSGGAYDFYYHNTSGYEGSKFASVY